MVNLDNGSAAERSWRRSVVFSRLARIQRSKCSHLRVRSRDLVRNAG